MLSPLLLLAAHVYASLMTQFMPFFHVNRPDHVFLIICTASTISLVRISVLHLFNIFNLFHSRPYFLFCSYRRHMDLDAITPFPSSFFIPLNAKRNPLLVLCYLADPCLFFFSHAPLFLLVLPSVYLVSASNVSTCRYTFPRGSRRCCPRVLRWTCTCKRSWSPVR